MKINSAENYVIKKDSEKSSELIAVEQEPIKENDLEALNSNFSKIENGYSEIINNPESSEEEKMQASIWRMRGKNLLYHGLTLLSLTLPLKATGQVDFSSSFNQLQNEINVNSSDQEKFNEENLKSSAANVITGRIIINEKTVDNFCKNYKNDPLFREFISGEQHWNFIAINAVEALKVWPGFKNMIKVLDDYRKNKK